MKLTVTQQGKIYEIDSKNEVKVYHTHDALISVCGEYYKNKYTGEWVSELEYEQSLEYEMDMRYLEQLEEDESNKYF